MSKQILWNKKILETFISEALLTEDEEIIMRTRVAGWSRLQQAEKLGISLGTVDRIIKSCKIKYDNVQKDNPDLPKRVSNK